MLRAATANDGTGANRARPRVFIVEADAAVRKGLRLFIEGEGYPVAAYQSAAALLAASLPMSGDVLLLALPLPDLSAASVVNVLGEKGVVPRVIIISGLDRTAHETAVRQIAPAGAFRKPPNLRALLRSIEGAQAMEDRIPMPGPYGLLRT